MKFLAKRALVLLCMCGFGLVAAGALRAFSQEEKKDAPAPAAAEAPVAAETPAAAAPAPIDPKAFPPYFTGTSPDPEKPLWPDATGANAGYWITPSPGPIGDGDPKTKTPGDLYDRIAHNLYSINFVWTLITGFLVMFMQAGFAFVEAGLGRAKNASHTMAMNFMIYPLGCFGFWAYGFALGWGNWFNGPVPDGWYASLGSGLSLLGEGLGIGVADPNAPNVFTYGLVGLKGFFLHGVEDVSVMAIFFFMMVFMDTTATIPTGTMSERWAWKNFCLYGLWVALPYCIYANWVWGGGWLAQAGKNWGLGHGAVDFAGSGVVHAMGGIIALAGGLVIGPRIGKFVHGKPHAMPGHNIPMVVLGTFILAFGWFGFNPGSTLAGTDLRISFIVVNTMLASVTAALGAMSWMMLKGLKPDTSMLCNGMLAGLVAITAPCAFVDSWAAAVIGVVAGVLVVESVFFWERMGVDDVVGAISVHGVNGIWGLISVGLFANGLYGAGAALPDGGGFGAGWNQVPARADMIAAYGVDGVRGLFYGDASQLWAQLLDSAVVCVFGFVMAYVWFNLSNLITPLRVSKETELAGLDGPEMGCLGYPDFVLHGHATDA
jgi:Amt family ammonium transporter